MEKSIAGSAGHEAQVIRSNTLEQQIARFSENLAALREMAGRIHDLGDIITGPVPTDVPMNERDKPGALLDRLSANNDDFSCELSQISAELDRIQNALS